MMRYIGMCLLFVGAGLVCYIFEGRQRTRRRQSEAILACLHALRRDLGCYARPLSTFACSYVDKEGQLTPFLSVLREGGRLGDAVASMREHWCLSASMAEAISRFAAAFGQGYREDELRALDNLLDEMQRCFREEETARPRQGRLCRTLCVSLSLLCVLLFL